MVPCLTLWDIRIGKELNDTYYAVSQVLTELMKNKIVPIVIGAGQDLTYTMYQVYEPIGKLINIAAIDPMFDIGNDKEALNSHSYLSHIILHQPNYLFNFTNIGYQSYYVDNENIELMKQLLFDVYRLGSIKQNIYLDQHTIKGTADERKLYELIWKRTIASQMADAQLERTNVNIGISTNDKQFVATGEVILFDGFLKVYMESYDDERAEDAAVILPPLEVGTGLDMDKMEAQQRFTRHPLRYTEASLVKKMEENY